MAAPATRIVRELDKPGLLGQRSRQSSGGDRFESKLIEKGMDLLKDLRWLAAGEREAQHALGCKLRAFLRVARDEFHQAARVDLGLLAETNVKLITLAVNLLHSQAFGGQAQRCGIDKVQNALRQCAITVFQLSAYIGKRRFIECACNFLVDTEALVLF